VANVCSAVCLSYVVRIVFEGSGFLADEVAYLKQTKTEELNQAKLKFITEGNALKVLQSNLHNIHVHSVKANNAELEQLVAKLTGIQ
jgi:hypothetical protein